MSTNDRVARAMHTVTEPRQTQTLLEATQKPKPSFIDLATLNLRAISSPKQ